MRLFRGEREEEEDEERRMKKKFYGILIFKGQRERQKIREGVEYLEGYMRGIKKGSEIEFRREDIFLMDRLVVSGK